MESRLKDVSFPMDRVHIVEGFFDENTSEKANLRKCSFAFVDFDLYKPILDALNYLSRILVVGGYIVVHDYGYFSSGHKGLWINSWQKTVKDLRFSFLTGSQRVLPFLKIQAIGRSFELCGRELIERVLEIERYACKPGPVCVGC